MTVDCLELNGKQPLKSSECVVPWEIVVAANVVEASDVAEAQVD